MSEIRDYRDLEVWRLGMDLTVEVYRLTRRLPADEKFGLTRQARRVAVSIPANVAEGHGRTSTGEYLQSLSISRGSLAELKTHLELMVCLEYLKRDDIRGTWQNAATVGTLLNALISALQKRKGASRTRRIRSLTPNPALRTHQCPALN